MTLPAINFRDLIAHTRMYIDEVAPKDWSDVEVKREINCGYHELVSATISVWEDYYQDNAIFGLIAGQQEYSSADGVPENIYKVRRIEIQWDPTITPPAWYKMWPMQDMNQVHDSLSNTHRGIKAYPYYYTYGIQDKFTIGFLPIPDITNPTGLKIWYIKEPVDMVNPLDIPQIPYADRNADAACLFAAAMLLRKGQQDETAAARYMAEFQTGKQDMMQELREKLADEPKAIQDSIGQNVDFSLV